jgi:hypothetical protein
MAKTRFGGRSCARASAATLALVVLAGCGPGDGYAPRDAGPAASSPPVPTTQGLQAVWGSAADDVWAVGDLGTVVHFDGKAWTAFDSGVTENLTGIFGAGASDIWASGDGGSVLHWNGKSWTVATQFPDTVLLGVWTGALNEAWIVGLDTSAPPGLGGGGFVAHWTGAMWSASDVPGSETLWKVWGSSATDVWLVGTEQQVGLIYRGDGSNFNPVDFTGDAIHGIWGSAPDDVWVAPLTGPAQHWDGSRWAASPALVPAAQAWHGLSGSGPDDVWVVGDQGNVGHYVAGRWTVSPAPTMETLFGIWSPSPSQAWLVGAKATALRWDGSGWY